MSRSFLTLFFLEGGVAPTIFDAEHDDSPPPHVEDDYEQNIDNFVLRSYLEIYKFSDDPEEQLQPEHVMHFLLKSMHHYGQNENILKDVHQRIYFNVGFLIV